MKKKILSITILILILLCNLCVYATDEQAEIPSKYDLRNDISIMVENQGQKGWCNAYVTTKIIETYLQKTKGINYNLSEAYLAYSEAEFFGGEDTYKKDVQSVNYYGVYDINRKYVLESEIPNKDYNFTEANKEKFKNADIVVKNAKFKEISNSEEAKKYIREKGGLSLSICYNEEYYNSSTSAIYSPIDKEQQLFDKIDFNNFDYGEYMKNHEARQKELYEIGSHAVVIIGWDDNYSRNNFNSNCRPEHDGAWLVLNSWGSNWGNNGTAWISYEDAYVKNMEFKGIEDITLKGELKAEFSYKASDKTITEDGNSKITKAIYTATIITNDEIEDIEGWTKSENNTYYGRSYTYTKLFSKEFEPYTIELHSKIDSATKIIEINIPEVFYEEIKKEHNIFGAVLQIITFIVVPILAFIFIIILIKKLISLPSKIYKNHKQNKEKK